MKIFRRSYITDRKISFMTIFLLLSLPTLAQFEKLTGAENTLQALKNNISDTARLRLMDDLAFYYIEKLGEKKEDLDSAFQVMQQSVPLIRRINNPAWTGKYYLLQSEALREAGDNPVGRSKIDTAVAIFQKHKLLLLEGDAMRETSQYIGFEAPQEALEKIGLLKKSAALYEAAGATEKEANCLENAGDIYNFHDYLDSAVQLLEKSLLLYKSINFKRLQGVYDLLGDTYSELGNNPKAVEYGLLAVQTAQHIHDTAAIVTFYNRLANSFNKATMYDEAISYYSKAINAALSFRDSADIILLNTNLSRVYLRLHQPEKALTSLKNAEQFFVNKNRTYQTSLYSALITTYTDLGRFQEASSYLNKLKAAIAYRGYSQREFQTIIHYFFSSGDYDKMYSYCDSLENFENEKKVGGAQYVHLYRFKADSALGKYVSAIKEFQLYKTIVDSLSNEKNKKEIARLNIAFETDRKDNEIKSNELHILNLEKTDRQKTEQINKVRLNRNVIFIITTLLLLLLGLLYNQYRVKQKNNEYLLKKQQEINNQNIALQAVVEEKEWLVKEIHHRVKNNLQVVMSLLNTQSDFSNNPTSFAAIQESRQRMFAMSLIHQKLYQAEQLTLVNMAIYIPELVDFLKDSFADGDRIRFELQIPPVDLDVSQAVPVGLILNELITNSIKYAFGNEIRGTINIIMAIEEIDGIRLIVRDNGSGLPDGIINTPKNTMGMQLIKTLSDQLGATLGFKNANGLQVELRFTRKGIANAVPV